MSLVYRAEGDERVELAEADERRASTGYSLLDSWRRIPGSHERGVASQKLQEWVAAARARLEQFGRLRVGDQIIGQMLSRSSTDEDGTWPTAAIRDLIEDLESTDVERGFYMGVVNDRGVVTKDPAAGGGQERAIAERYAGLAAAVSSTYPRTARVLRQLADGYRRHAQHEDYQADMGQDLDG